MGGVLREKISVSIIIPVYNVSVCIERCLRSVIAQSYPIKECIIVDDATPDDSISQCERLVVGYDGPIHFVILYHERNRGLSAARNTGTDAAKGDYIFYLDSDDELTSDCIEKLAKPIEKNPSIEMVVGNYQRFSDNPCYGKIVREEEFTSSAAVREFFYGRRILYIAAWNKLMSKQFLTDHKLNFIEGILYEDVPWTYYVMKYLQHLYVIPSVTYHYYVRPLSISTSTSKYERAKNYGIVYEEIAKHFTLEKEAWEAKYYLVPYFSFFMRNRRVESFKRALPFFEKALADGECQRETLLLWVLRLSSKSAFLYWAFSELMTICRVVRYPFRRVASLLEEKRRDGWRFLRA